MWIKTIVLVVLAFVLFQLFYALSRLVKGDKKSATQMARALMWRVLGSLLIFALILLAYSMGYLQPSGHLFS